jgi:SWI/SNF-related matrix-associated actin-dependent regulator of chromatin subfamily D
VIVYLSGRIQITSNTFCLYRKRKLTDKTLPNAVLQHPHFAADSKMYQDLLEMERKLDWTMTRKKVEVQDALVRTPTVRVDLRCGMVAVRATDIHCQTTRTLRIFLSHTVTGQVWQTSETAPAEGGEAAVNFETGQGIPAWAIKIEGRLLEVCEAACCIILHSTDIILATKSTRER